MHPCACPPLHAPTAAGGPKALTAGSHHEPVLTVAWPTAEFGGMGLEGAIRLGFRKVLEAEEDLEAGAGLGWRQGQGQAGAGGSYRGRG